MNMRLPTSCFEFVRQHSTARMPLAHADKLIKLIAKAKATGHCGIMQVKLKEHKVHSQYTGWQAPPGIGAPR